MKQFQAPDRPDAGHTSTGDVLVDANEARKRIVEIMNTADKTVADIDELLNELAEEMKNEVP